MSEKPVVAAGYPPGQAARVKSVCLYLATKLGDLMGDLVVVGGLVPSLLIDQENLPESGSPHVGTLDLDLGLALALVEEQRYQTVAQRLRAAGFTPDVNENGNATHQRWRIGASPVTVDFLIEPENAAARAGGLFRLASDWAAFIAPGLHLAFMDHQTATLTGRTIMEEKASRSIRVCGAGAYVALKALAFQNRGENKDAYDLFYLLQNYGRDVSDTVDRFRALLPDAAARKALECLKEDFCESEATGPRRVAEFFYGRRDNSVQADVAGAVRQFVQLTEA